MRTMGYMVAMVSIISSASAARAQATCGHEPLVFTNARYGDVIISSAEKGVIKGLLTSIGQTYSHTGVIQTGPQWITQIRHNTLKPEAMKLRYSDPLNLLPASFKATGSKSLRDGYPGIEQISADYNWSTNPRAEFNSANSLLLSGASRTAAARSAAATEFYRMVGWYRFYAFTDVSWSDYYDVDWNEGNMCSGAIAWSYVGRGEPGWGTIQYDEALRNQAAPVLYNLVYRSIMNADPGFWGRLVNAVLNVVSADLRRRLAVAGSNQVVNCMAFNDCGNLSSTRWKAGVGAGSSLSPDNLLLLTYLNLVFGNQTFAFDTTKTIATAGGYDYCL